MQYFDMLCDSLNTIIEFIEKFKTLISTAILIYSYRSWKNNKKNEAKQNENIHITLKKPDTELYTLIQTVKRRYVSRAEIQGLLANAYSEKYYNIPYLCTSAYSAQIEAIQKGDSNHLTIEIEDKEEFNKFTSTHQ